LAEHVARMGDKRNSYALRRGSLKEETLGRPGHRWKDAIKIGPKLWECAT